MHTVPSSGMYFAQMSRNLTTKYYFFIENTLCKNTFYVLKIFCPKFSFNGVPSVDRDVMQGAHGIPGRE